MLSLQIDNPALEERLQKEFKTSKELSKYIYNLVVEDLEEKRFLQLTKEQHKKEFVSKKEVFDILDTI